MADGVTVANAFVQVMPSMEGATSNITSVLVPELEKSGDKAGAGFGSAFSGKAGAALKVAGGAIVGAFAVDAVKDAFVGVESGLNNVKVATGATGEAANELKAVYLEASKNVVGSFEDIGSAVGELNTRFGLEGAELEKASEAMMKYAKVTGQDATSATKDVASMMRNVGIPSNELADTLGKLTVAGQAAGVDVSSLANNITKYNSVMKQLGLTTDEQIALMSKFEVSGADTMSILNAMKKGVATWAKEGKDARTEFENFVNGVQDGTVTAGDAVEIFGSKGGLSIYEAASKGQLAFEDMFQTIASASEENLNDIYQDTLTAGEKFDLLGKKVQTGFFEVLEPLVDEIMPYIDVALDGVGDAVQGVVDFVVPLIKEFGESMMPIVQEVMPKLQNAIQTTMDVISRIFHAVWPVVSQIVVTAVDVISGAIEGMSALVNVVSDVFGSIERFIEDPLGSAQQFIQDFANNISGIFNGLDLSLPQIALPHFNVWGGEFPYGIGGMGSAPEFSIEWYGAGGFANTPTLNGYGERGLEFYWPSYEPYFEKYAQGIAKHMPTNGVDIHDCTFNVRNDSDIRRVAQELNTLINRQSVGAFA